MPEDRTILIHLNLEVPPTEERSAEEIAEAILQAFEVGSDDDSVKDLFPQIVLAEEI